MVFERLKKKKNKNVEEKVRMNEVRKHIIFTGRVQGVGFRYRSSYVARAREITGWVKNNWDGTVEMEAQGEDAQIEGMLAALNKDSFIRIEKMDITEIPLEEHESGFHIRG